MERAWRISANAENAGKNIKLSLTERAPVRAPEQAATRGLTRRAHFHILRADDRP